MAQSSDDEEEELESLFHGESDDENDDEEKNLKSKKFTTETDEDNKEDEKKSRFVKGRFKQRKQKNKDDAEENEKKAEEEMEKVNDALWPFGNRSWTSTEKIITTGGLTAGIVGIGSCAAIAAGAFTGISAIPAMCTMVAGGLTAVTVPHTIYNQTQITKMDTFRDVINMIRSSINTFAGENEKLHDSVDELEENVEKLKELENGLIDIAKRQGVQMDELNALLEENRRINRELKKVLKASALQRMLALIIECDTNQDFKLSGMELNRFVMGLKNIEELDVDTDDLLQQLKQYDNFDVNTFLDLVSDLLFEKEEEEVDEADRILNQSDVDEKAMQCVSTREFLKKKREVSATGAKADPAASDSSDSEGEDSSEKSSESDEDETTVGG